MPEFVPSQEAVLSLMVLVENSPEGAEYLAMQFTMLLKDQKLTGKYQDVTDGLTEFSNKVATENSVSGLAWAGRVVPTTVAEKTEIQPAQEEGANISLPQQERPSREDVNVEIPVYDTGFMDRFYTVDSGEVSEATQTELDRYFLEWIAKSGLFRLKEIMYLSNKHGDGPLMKDGHPVPVSPKELKAKLEDEKTGLAPYIKEHSHGRIQVQKFDVQMLKAEPVLEVKHGPDQEHDGTVPAA